MNRAIVDVIEENNRQRFLVRREAERKRGANLEVPIRSSPRVGSPRPVRSVLSPMPWLFICVAFSGLAIWALAVVGAYALIRLVVGQ